MKQADETTLDDTELYCPGLIKPGSLFRRAINMGNGVELITSRNRLVVAKSLLSPTCCAFFEKGRYMFIIQRTSDGKMVACSGSKHSYTSSPQRARSFNSREEAEKHLCPENEQVVNINDLFQKAMS